MVIRKLLASDFPPLFAVFDSFVRGLPHGFPIGPDEFCGSLSGQPAHLRMSDVVVAEENGIPVGFLRAGVYRSVGDRWSFAKPSEGLLFGPFVRQEHMDAGRQLISAGLRALRERVNSPGRIVAFDPVESVGAPYFNGGWSGLSELRPYVVELYARAGFRLRYRELCLFRPTLDGLPSPPPIPPKLTLSLETRDRHRLSVKLYDRGVYAGACHYSRMFPRRACDPDAATRGYIDGLAVPDDYQGRGLGKLLLLHGLSRMRDLGCDSVSLTTASDNFRAQNLYFSLGFRVTDSCVSLVCADAKQTVNGKNPAD
jgi:ribosomal protein S18 acetylase RimI-like enzyme